MEVGERSKVKRNNKRERETDTNSRGHAKTTAVYVSFQQGSYPGPERCSLAWVFTNAFVDSSFMNNCIFVPACEVD
jgi:hypothetical protein